MSLSATLVTTAKNEGPYIWEWVAYHKMVGFENIIIFQNDSDDGTDAILKALRDAGLVKYLYNRAPRGRHQVRAYNRSAKQDEYRASDFVMDLDMDEFLVIRPGKGRFKDLIEALPSFDCAFINWKMFGSAGALTLSDDLVTERFILTEHDARVHKYLCPFKSLYRRSKFSRPGVHRPLGLDIENGKHRVVNGSGLRLPHFEEKKHRSTDPKGRSIAQINHYIVKDAMSFVLKNHKGSAHQADRPIGRKYWKNRNFNEAEERRIQRLSIDLNSEMLAVDHATNGAMRRLTKQARDHHRNRFEDLIKSDQNAVDLYDFCRSHLKVEEDVNHLLLSN